nr:hypothetical protein [Streptomyces misionensis]
MTAELVRGQNHPLTQLRLEIRISAGTPVLAGATLGDENGTVHGSPWVAHPGAPVQPGIEVSRRAAGGHRLTVDLSAVPEAVHRVGVFLALPAGASGSDTFGAVAAPHTAVHGPDGTGVHLLMVADRADAADHGPLLDPLWRSLTRLTPVPDDHVADPWVGHAWTYEPALVPVGSRVLERVLGEVATARAKKQ